MPLLYGFWTWLLGRVCEPRLTPLEKILSCHQKERGKPQHGFAALSCRAELGLMCHQESGGCCQPSSSFSRPKRLLGEAVTPGSSRLKTQLIFQVFRLLPD